MSFHLNGIATEGWMFVMRLSASGRGYHRIYLNLSQQVFLDGHLRPFEHFGGLPDLRIRYDNLKPAVARALKGRDRQETERFVALCSHYGFDSFFCIPSNDGAHEKGVVEGRGRPLPPPPHGADASSELHGKLDDPVAAGDTTHPAVPSLEDDRRHPNALSVRPGEVQGPEGAANF